jgi:hypothetical protein
MYKENTRILKSWDMLEFTVAGTDRKITLCLLFVQEGKNKGVAFDKERSVIPKGMTLLSALGKKIIPGDGYIVPKNSNACAVKDIDGSTYDLFSVKLVDTGDPNRGFSGSDQPGGVINFHSANTAAGILKFDPDANLERG